MTAPTLKEIRNYCRTKYGANWWDTDKNTKKARKQEALRALTDDEEENIPLCQLVPQKPKIVKKPEIVPQKPVRPTLAEAKAKVWVKKMFRKTVLAEMMTKFASEEPRTFVKNEQWYEENIANKPGFREVTSYIHTSKTKNALGLKGGRIRVFVHSVDNDEFDERANTKIVYKYDVLTLPSHPLGKDTEWGFASRCPQGIAYVIVKEKTK